MLTKLKTWASKPKAAFMAFAMSVGLFANPVFANTSIEEIGTTAAAAIAKFAVAVGAVGAAVLTVVVLIQGFRMVFKFIRTGV